MTLVVNRNVLSPHFIPDELLFRENEIKEIYKILEISKKGEKPPNLFIYGKTGTGKTCTVKKAIEKLGNDKGKANIVYLNCRIYNSRYRILQRFLKEFVPELEKSGFGLPYLYEKLLGLMREGKQLVMVLDEIDMVKDLDELIYTLTRSNDEVKEGGVTIIGISNKISFKNQLDPRSKSSLYESELIFSPYTAVQLQKILKQRVELGLVKGSVEDSAINLAAAIAAQESGDARYALKLLEKAIEIAEKEGKEKISDYEIELARKKVDLDLVAEVINTLPENHLLTLYAIAKLTYEGKVINPLDAFGESGFIISGDAYREYEKISKIYNIRPRSSRWFKEYLNDLETLGIITTTLSGKGLRGQTTLIKLDYDSKGLLEILKSKLGR